MWLSQQVCHTNPAGSILCYPADVKTHTATEALGGGHEAKGTITCPAGYTYMGKNCIRDFAIALNLETYSDAETSCGDDDMIYISEDQQQNLAFRHAMMVKVVKGKH